VDWLVWWSARELMFVQRRTQGGGHWGPPNGYMIVYNGEAILGAENSGNLWAVGAPSRTPLGELSALPEPLAGGDGVCSPIPFSTLGLDFPSFGQ